MNVKEQYWKYSLVTIIVVLGTILLWNSSLFWGGIFGACTIYILYETNVRIDRKEHLR